MYDIIKDMKNLKLLYFLGILVFPLLNINALNVSNINSNRYYSVSPKKVDMSVEKVVAYRGAKNSGSYLTITTEPKAEPNINYVLFCYSPERGKVQIYGKLKVSKNVLWY